MQSSLTHILRPPAPCKTGLCSQPFPLSLQLVPRQPPQGPLPLSHSNRAGEVQTGVRRADCSITSPFHSPGCQPHSTPTVMFLSNLKFKRPIIFSKPASTLTPMASFIVLPTYWMRNFEDCLKLGTLSIPNFWDNQQSVKMFRKLYLASARQRHEVRAGIQTGATTPTGWRPRERYLRAPKAGVAPF